MDLYIIIITVIGLASLGMAWMPAIARRTNVSYSIWYVLGGFLLYKAFDFFPNPDPLRNEESALRLTELVVIISLMGTGLKIDEKFSLKRWALPFRLVTITMILSIAAVAFAGTYFLGLNPASAILLGAVLAPTDPVLASDVQVGPPLDNSYNNVRFALTAEAGMNDGMAFPFTWLAIILATTSAGTTWFSDWLWTDVALKIGIGVISGFCIGRALAWLLFYLPQRTDFAEVRDGFVAISVTLVTYGITELLQGYGFIAVFVSAITIRNYEMHHDYHVKLHSFTDQIERILLSIFLILFGGSLATGVLSTLTWKMVVFSLLFLIAIRPLSALLGMIGCKLHIKEKLVISFFGIRGVGTFFYLAFAIKEAEFDFADDLWAISAFVVLISIIIHGATAALGMRKVEEVYKRGQ